MRIEKGDGTKLSFFQDLYREARAECEEHYADLDKFYRQYKGTKDIDGSEVQAKLVRNITYELVESQVTSYLPNPSVAPRMWSEKNERNAKSIETLLKNKRNELPFEKMNDMDERYNPIYGGSVWLCEWDESITTHNTVGDVRITCLSPKHFTGQPNIYEIDDMEYCFVEFETTKEDIVRKYGVTPSVADETESDENADDKTATLYVCFYKNDDDKICQYVWSGDTELLDIEDYYSRKRYICKKCGKRKELCDCEKPDYELQNDECEELDRDIPLSGGQFIPAESEMIRDGKIVTEMQTRPMTGADGRILMRNAGRHNATRDRRSGSAENRADEIALLQADDAPDSHTQKHITGGLAFRAVRLRIYPPAAGRDKQSGKSNNRKADGERRISDSTGRLRG